MAIEKLPEVKVGGSDTLFGGSIYNLSFNVASGLEGGNATTLKLNIASEDGKYTISEKDLNTDQHYDVQIGNFKLPMYLESYRELVSPNGNVLEVTFIDGSFVLDKCWVGLDKHVWDLDDRSIQSRKPKWLIVVGKEIHPCDTDGDGDFDERDQIDPCDPCIPEDMRRKFEAGQITIAQLQRGVLDCKEMAKTQIFDVQYTFDDLIKEAKKATGLTFVNSAGKEIKAPNTKYKQKYQGRLRDVLRNWAADFGWTFFFTDKKVVFIDVSHGIRVAKTIKDFCPNVAEYVNEVSLKGTVTGNLITHFRRPGEVRDFICEDARYIPLVPYRPGNRYVVPALEITEDIDDVAAGLCYYDPYLRDLYWWFIRYKMGDTKNFKVMKKIPQLGLIILSEPIELNLGTSGGTFKPMTIEPATNLDFPQGYPIGQADMEKSFLDAVGLSSELAQVQAAIQADEKFMKLFSLLAPKEQWAYAQNAKDYFFFIGYYDEEVEAEYIMKEREFANDFLGKYYVYSPDLTKPDEKAFFEDDRIISDETQCGKRELIQDGKLVFTSLNRNEDSVQYDNAPATTAEGDIPVLSRLPFAKFLKVFRNSSTSVQQAGGPRGQNFKLLTVTVNGDRFFPTPNARGTEEDNASQHDIQNKELINQAHAYYIRQVPSKLDDSQEDVISAMLVQDKELYAQLEDNVKDVTRIFLFWGRKTQSTDFQLQKAPLWYHEAQAPGYKFDGIPMNERKDEITNRNEIVYKYPHLRCKDMGRWNNRAPRINFHTPVAKFSYTAPSDSAYGVIIEKSKRITIRTERMQLFFVEGQQPSNKTLSIQVNQNDISDDDLRNRKMERGTCRYSKDQIKKLHDERKTGLSFTNEQPSISRSFTIAGLAPNVPKITEGLISIDMSLDRSGGVKTTYTLGTTLMQIPNQDAFNGLEFSSSKKASVAIPNNAPYKQASNR